MEKRMEKEKNIMKMVNYYMRENLKMIKEKDMGNYIFLMEINMKVNFNQIILTVMEYFIILKVIDLKENLKMIKEKDME